MRSWHQVYFKWKIKSVRTDIKVTSKKPPLLPNDGTNQKCIVAKRSNIYRECLLHFMLFMPYLLNFIWNWPLGLSTKRKFYFSSLSNTKSRNGLFYSMDLGYSFSSSQLISSFLAFLGRPRVNFTKNLWAHLRQYTCDKKVQT